MAKKEVKDKKDLKEALVDLLKDRAEDIVENILDEMVNNDRIAKFVGENYDIQDVFEEEEITNVAQASFAPADIFSEDELKEWAEENGYIPENDEEEDDESE